MARAEHTTTDHDTFCAASAHGCFGNALSASITSACTKSPSTIDIHTAFKIFGASESAVALAALGPNAPGPGAPDPDTLAPAPFCSVALMPTGYGNKHAEGERPPACGLSWLLADTQFAYFTWKSTITGM